MALVLNDRVKETTTTTGTGTLNLAGAATNFETFVAGIGDGNTVYYAIVHQSAAEFEVGLGTVTDGSPDTLSRTTILSSSNSDSAVDFSSGTKDVFCTLPASKTVFEDGSGNVTLPGTLSTASDLTIDNGSINLTYDVSAGELNHAGATFHINKSNGVDVAIGNDDLYVDMSTSRVGIGTQSPQVPLHVSHATAPNFRLSRTGTGQIYQFGIDSSGRFSISEAASEGGTKHQRFVIDDSGEVGIGTAAPSSNLHIKTSVDDSVAQGLVIERSANTDKGYINYQGGAFRLIATDGDPIKIGHVSNTDRVEITSGGDVTLTGNLAHASDFTIDVGGDLFLDADGGQVYFQDGGVLHGSIDMTSGLILRNHVSDADVFIQGNDGGTNINALKLDMSNNGRAIFNAGAGFSDHVNFDDNAQAVFGGGDDLKIYHDGSDSYIQDAGTGDLKIKATTIRFLSQNDVNETMMTVFEEGAVNLMHNGSTKFSTTSTGINVTGTVVADGLTVDSGTTNTVATFTSTDSGAGFNLTDDSGTSTIQTNGANLRIGVDEDGAVSSSAIQFRVDGSTKATINNSGVLDVDGGITVDNITIDGTEIDLSSGDLTIDVAGDITLDADGADIKLSDGGTEFGRFTKSGNDFELRSTVTNGDFKIIGERTSGTVNAMTIDMSDGGAVSFNSKITSNNIRLENGILAQSSGDLTIDVAGDINLDADGGEILLKDGGTEVGRFLLDDNNHLKLKSIQSDADILFQGNDGGSGITALRLDMSDAGTATFNNGVVVQGDLTVQGTTTTLNTATLDVEDKNITLNFGSGDTSGSANGAGITIQDAVSASNDATILWDATNDEFDFSHTVNVTGSVVAQTKLAVGATAVHGSFDFYNQNTAYFNGAVTINDNLSITAGSISITGDGSNATTLTESGSGDFTIDASGDITLDADGADIRFKDAGNTFGLVSSNNADEFVIQAGTQDKDIIFKGNDGGSEITALTLDISDAGTATFNHDVKLGDNGIAKFGTGNDLQIYHDGSDSYINGLGTGNVIIRNSTDDADILFQSDDGSGSVTTYFFLDGSGTRTQFQQHSRHIDNIYAAFGSDADLRLFHDGTDSKIQQSSGATGNLIIEQAIDDKDIILKSDDGSGGVAAYITLDGSTTLTQFDKDTKHVDSVKASFGDSSDLQIFHDGSNSFIQDAGTGDLEIKGENNVRIKTNTGGENMAAFTANGAVSLFHDNSEKFATTSSGVTVTGDVGATTATIAGDISQTTGDYLYSGGGNFDIKHSTASQNIVFSTTPSGGSTAEVLRITHDGKLSKLSGDLTLDVAGDIVLDADGGDISFKDAGTEIGNLSNSSSDFVISSAVNDKDLKFQGVTGSSVFTALTLDMSAAGKALFNNDIERVSGDLTVSSATGSVVIDANTSSGDILLDADGGTIVFLDAGTEIGLIAIDNVGFLDFSSSVSDSDIRLRGNDGGSMITALTLDMSEAGAATFNNNVTAFSDERLKDNIETLEDGLDKVEQLRGVTYTRDGRENIGVIAQEVEKILPEIVKTADDEMGTKSVDYSRITAVLIEAVKDLSARVKELENK